MLRSGCLGHGRIKTATCHDGNASTCPSPHFVSSSAPSPNGFDRLAREAVCTMTTGTKTMSLMVRLGFLSVRRCWMGLFPFLLPHTKWHGHHPDGLRIFGTCYRLPQKVCAATYFFSSWILAKAWTAFCPLNMMDPEILEQCKMNWELSPSSLLPLG